MIASGLLEHVGVAESSHPYRVRARPDKRQARAAAVRELVRVADAHGACLLDFPNGLFPVDFWHGDRAGSFRLHRVPDVLNPSLSELRSYLPEWRLDVLPLLDRLRFRQISRRWWGRALAPLVMTSLRLLDRIPNRAAAPIRALVYPFLVVRIGT